MGKLINKIKKYNPVTEIDEFDDEDMSECEMEISFEPMVNKETGEIVAVLEVHTCLNCGESYVNQMFTNGEEDLEYTAWEMGYREDFED